jgi:hypothetical protein
MFINSNLLYTKPDDNARAFLTSTPGIAEWSASRSRRLIQRGKIFRHPLYGSMQWVPEPMWIRCLRVKSQPLLWIESMASSLQSHFTVEDMLAQYNNGKYVPAWKSGIWTDTGPYLSLKNYKAVAYCARMHSWRPRIIQVLKHIRDSSPF